MRWPWPFSRRRTDAAALPAPRFDIDEAARLAQSPAVPERARRRLDNWTNPANGMGVTGADPALATYFLAQTGISDEEAVALDRADPIAAKVINKVVDEAFRPGFELEVAEDDTARDNKGKRAGVDERPAVQLAKDVKARWKALGVFEAVDKACRWERRECGAAILLGTVDVGAAAGLATPLPAEGPVELRWLRVLRAQELYPASYYSDPSGAKFDEPEIWQVTQGRHRGSVPLRVHESRLIIFPGVTVVDGPYAGQMRAGFGDSVLLRFYRALRRYGSTMAGIEKLLSRYGQPVMKMAQLAKLMAGDAAGQLAAALDAYEYAASTFNVRVLAAEDEYSTQAPSVAGIADLIAQVRGELQAAADMPLTILFGDQVGGLGDTGTAAKRDWLDTVDAWRQKKPIPAIERITALILRGLGNGTLPGEWNVVGNRLWHPTAKEQADIDLIEMQVDTGYLTGGVVLPEQVMRRQAVATRYSIDLAELDEIEAARAAMPGDVRKPGAPDPDAADEPDPEDPGEDDEPGEEPSA